MGNPQKLNSLYTLIVMIKIKCFDMEIEGWDVECLLLSKIVCNNLEHFLVLFAVIPKNIIPATYNWIQISNYAITGGLPGIMNITYKYFWLANSSYSHLTTIYEY